MPSRIPASLPLLTSASCLTKRHPFPATPSSAAESLLVLGSGSASARLSGPLCVLRGSNPRPSPCLDPEISKWLKVLWGTRLNPASDSLEAPYEGTLQVCRSGSNVLAL